MRGKERNGGWRKREGGEGKGKERRGTEKGDEEKRGGESVEGRIV